MGEPSSTKGPVMHVATTDIPSKLKVPGVIVRQLPDFGAASAILAAEHLSLAAGTDIAPLLHGLPNDACQSEHWGYVLSGTALVTYTDGASERCSTGHVFYWPAGHSVRIEENAEIVMFSPATAHGDVLNHIGAQLAAMA
jgi:mannose-6-phosphate isomerase-like protein (cupin superfamily)